MTCNRQVLIDLQYAIEKIEALRVLKIVEKRICAEDREELDRIWIDQAQRGMCIKQPKAMT